MKLHPLHPVSVHAPLACIALAPLADLGAILTHRVEFWSVGAALSAAAPLFGLIAASIGALDFDRAYAKAPKTVSWHAVLMVLAVTLAAVSGFGRFDAGLAVLTPPSAWAIVAGVAALIVAAIGGALGGELVYRHGVNVELSPKSD